MRFEPVVSLLLLSVLWPAVAFAVLARGGSLELLTALSALGLSCAFAGTALRRLEKRLKQLEQRLEPWEKPAEDLAGSSREEPGDR